MKNPALQTVKHLAASASLCRCLLEGFLREDEEAQRHHERGKAVYMEEIYIKSGLWMGLVSAVYD